MNTVSNTAYYCCGIRMLDANKTESICNDIYAERFMDEKGREIFEPFISEKMPNISNISRCRLIDDYLKDELQKNPHLNLVTIGAGFDTRPFRITGGNWYEIDEPQIIEYKNSKLPVEECVNPLRRISINFSEESLLEKLSDVISGNNIVVIIEGVFMYLDEVAIESTLGSLQKLFPEHTLYCDLMTKRFFSRFAQSVHDKLMAAGGTFTERPESPEKIFVNHGYRKMESVPMFKKARELGLLQNDAKIPKFVSWLMLNLFVKDLNGYAVHRFAYDS